MIFLHTSKKPASIFAEEDRSFSNGSSHIEPNNTPNGGGICNIDSYKIKNKGSSFSPFILQKDVCKKCNVLQVI